MALQDLSDDELLKLLQGTSKQGTPTYTPAQTPTEQPTAEAMAQPRGQDAQNFKLSEPPLIDPQEVGLSSGVGGLLGAGLALTPIGRGVGLIRAGLTGAAEGAVGSTAGQLYERVAGDDASALARIGVEAAAGVGIPAAVKAAGKLTSTIGGNLPLGVGESVKALVKAVSPKESAIALRKSKNVFGREVMPAGTSTFDFSQKVVSDQAERVGKFLDVRVLSPKALENLPPTHFPNLVRGKMIEVQKDLASKGITWKDSPQFKQLISELKSTGDTSVITTLKKIANQQVSNIPEQLGAFEKNMLNLVQQADGTYKQMDVSPEVIDMVKRQYDDFFVKNTGTPYYSTLKQLERESKVAVARDSIPTIFNNNFSGSNEVKQALKNIKQSPEGVQDLKVALTSYLRTLPEDKIVSQWNNISNVLSETKVLPFEEIKRITGLVNKSKSAPAKLRATAEVLAQDAILGAFGAEAGRLGSEGKDAVYAL